MGACGSPDEAATTPAAVAPAGAEGAIGGSSAAELALGSSSARGGATLRGLSGVGDEDEGAVVTVAEAPAAAEEPEGALASAGTIATDTEGTRATPIGAAAASAASSMGADGATD